MEPLGDHPCGVKIMDKDEKFNSFSHLAGAALSLTGLVFLVVRASFLGDPWKIVSCSIYGATLVVLYLFSTLYHGIQGTSKKTFQKIDHGAIYLLIAGTYTPFTLVTLRGDWGWSLFGVVWGLALAGIIQDLLLTSGKRVLSVIIYLLMGWLAITAIKPLTRALPIPGLIWLIAGGLFYTFGVIFYALDKKILYGHEIFHVFVLASSVCHYAAIYFYVL